MKNILLSIDQFGVKPELNFNNEDKFNTKTGGVISILFFIVLILGCAYFSQELFNKQKPSILQADIYDSDPMRFNITPDNFGLFLGIEDKDFNYYIDPTIYQIKASIETVYRTFDNNNQPVFNFSSTPIRTEQCVLERHFPNFIEQFESQPLKGLNCIHPHDANSLFMDGFWGEESFVYLFARFFACKNGTDVVCKSQEVIDEYLNGGFIGIDFVNTIFDPVNYTTPHKYVRKDYYSTISNLYFKEINFYMNNVDYYTDQGILTEYDDLKQHLIFETAIENFDMRKQDNFANVVFRLSNMRLSVQRKYMKFQDFLAQMGGLMNGLLVVLNYLLSNYFLNGYFSTIINKLLITQGDETQAKKNVSLPTHGNLQTAKINTSRPVNIYKLPQQESTKSLVQLKVTVNEEQLKQIERKKRKLTLSFCENIRLAFCRFFDKNKTKNILFNKGKLRIESHVNIVNINQKFEEYDIIKNILFDKNATCILAYLKQNKVLKVDDVNPYKHGVKPDDVIKAYRNLQNNNINESLKKHLEEMISSFLNRN
jgi:hypothetical protein